MQEAHIPRCRLFESGEDPTVVLDLADETLDQTTLPVEVGVICAGLAPIRSGWYYCDGPASGDLIYERSGIVCSVCDHILTLESIYQLGGLGDIVYLTAG